MPKLEVHANDAGTVKQYWFYCPGCKGSHAFTVPPWKFVNGDFEKPTFRPSLLCNKSDPKTRCHLKLVNGVLQFCGDCHHALKSTDVELPEIESLWQGDDT